jgi:geranylgeranyl pyrophosphate synthase
MNDEEYFVDTYKTIAFSVVNEISKQSDFFIETFDKNDLMRKETVRFMLEGGKRFRPSLSYFVAKSFGHDDLFPHLALETFHKYLLAHDDVIDRDDVRYSNPTVHKKLEEILTNKSKEEIEHFGNSLGIIAGDLMEASTYKLIFKSDLSDATKVKLGQLVVQAVEEVVWGWYDQFLMDYLPLNSDKLSVTRIEESIIWVTGKYTMKFPIYFGCAVSGVEIPEGLDHLADDLGVLFQTGDDLIGIFGDPETTGKSNFGDIVQGKKTLPIYFTYKNANQEDKLTLERLVGKRDLTPGEAEVVREIVKRSGGLERTKNVMREYRDACLGQIDELGIPDDLKKFLRGFAIFLEKRDH